MNEFDRKFYSPHITNNLLLGLYKDVISRCKDPTASGYSLTTVTYTSTDMLYFSGEEAYYGASSRDRHLSEYKVLLSLSELISQDKIGVFVIPDNIHPIVGYYITPKGFEEAKSLSAKG